MVMLRRRQKPVTWVVYRRTTTFKRKRYESNAVCEQSEWDAMDLAEPGVRTLVRAGFETESDAEKHARGTSGDTYRRGIRTQGPEGRNRRGLAAAQHTRPGVSPGRPHCVHAQPEPARRRLPPDGGQAAQLLLPPLAVGWRSLRAANRRAVVVV